MVKAGLLLCSTLILPAQLIFTETEATVNIPAEATTYEIEFPFTAQGEVSLLKINEKCSCIKGVFSDGAGSWKDGEKGVLTLTLDPSVIKGRTLKTVDLLFSDFPAQSISVEALVPIAITSDFKSHKWEVGQQPESKDYVIEVAPNFPLEVETISRSDPSFNFKISPMELLESGGKRYTFSVSPSDLSKNAFCLFKLETNSKIERYKSFSLMAIIQE